MYRLVTRGTIDQVMVERAQAKRTLERLVVRGQRQQGLRDKVKPLDGAELMALLVKEEVAATCSAGKVWGLEEETLERLLDRSRYGGGEELGETFEEGKFNVKRCRVDVGAKVEQKEVYLVAPDIDFVEGFNWPEMKRKREKVVKAKAKAKARRAWKQFDCDQCLFSSKSSTNLNDHKTRKHSGIVFNCDMCLFTTTNRNSMSHHRNNNHKDDKPLTCDKCEFIAPWNAVLYTHKKEFHKGTFEKISSLPVSKRPFAFFIFKEDNKSGVKEKNPELKVHQVAQELNKMWTLLDPEERVVYEKLAVEHMEKWKKKQTEDQGKHTGEQREQPEKQETHLDEQEQKPPPLSIHIS